MKKTAIFISVTLISLSSFATNYTHTDSSATFYLQGSIGHYYTDYHTINVSGASYIRVQASGTAIDYGVADIIVFNSSMSGQYESLTIVGPGPTQQASDQAYWIVPANCIIMLSTSQYAVAGIYYNAISSTPNAQTTSHLISTVDSPTSLEYNLLFNAIQNYTVSDNFPGIDESGLFDGKLNNVAITSGTIGTSNPYEITIDDLPSVSTQEKCFVGFLSAEDPPANFIIEGGTTSSWKTIAVADTNTSKDFLVEISDIISTCEKITFSIYGVPDSDDLGIAELVFIHTKAAAPYEGLYVSAQDGMAFEEFSDPISSDEHARIGWGDASLGVEGDLILLPNTEDTASIRFFTNNGSSIGERFRIDKDGKVGIGTVSLVEELTVNGTILAEEVVITSDVEDYPDYVFEKGYPLMPLDELHAFLEQNAHLPEVPSAKEAAKEGIPMAGMSKILLQKIEELTLYTIRSHQEIQLLKQEIKQLKLENTLLRQTEPTE